ncbi:hypothetical protein MRS76_11195 [Rhizobiaceae bacterium n13]|uniref:hypothetical protein n=1 Tax=Ferirhizobium litorale TaxID=2927786 RepID=UPI0024B2CD39|nr:hypothetical protein [Fererhizobium litorale]MDI7862526.1 hypothetical protein [Fererhizobium litorale]
MANFSEQVVHLWEEWVAETGNESADPGDFVDWALLNRRLSPNPLDIKQMLRRQVTQSLRQARRWDEDGCFTYRAFQSATLFEGGQAIKHYFDTDTGGSPALRQKSVKQRRDAIASDVYRAVCDVERMNKVHQDEQQLNFFTDFTDDVAELRIAESDDDDADAA